jgi:hypothetical protein
MYSRTKSNVGTDRTRIKTDITDHILLIIPKFERKKNLLTKKNKIPVF